jgi:antirestriction protein ArdC
LDVLKDDRSLIIKAAQQAQKAVDRILAFDPTADQS